MDPRQTLQDAESHLQAGELAKALTCLADYWAWRRRGGFEPPGGDDRAHELAARAQASDQP